MSTFPYGETGGVSAEECVDCSAVVDLAAGYQVPDTRATVQLSISNVLDRSHR